MRRFFEEPSVCVERFAVADDTMLFTSGINLADDELNAIGVPAITSAG